MAKSKFKSDDRFKAVVSPQADHELKGLRDYSDDNKKLGIGLETKRRVDLEDHAEAAGFDPNHMPYFRWNEEHYESEETLRKEQFEHELSSLNYYKDDKKPLGSKDSKESIQHQLELAGFDDSHVNYDDNFCEDNFNDNSNNNHDEGLGS